MTMSGTPAFTALLPDLSHPPASGGTPPHRGGLRAVVTALSVSAVAVLAVATGSPAVAARPAVEVKPAAGAEPAGEARPAADIPADSLGEWFFGDDSATTPAGSGTRALQTTLTPEWFEEAGFENTAFERTVFEEAGEESGLRWNIRSDRAHPERLYFLAPGRETVTVARDRVGQLSVSLPGHGKISFPLTRADRAPAGGAREIGAARPGRLPVMISLPGRSPVRVWAPATLRPEQGRGERNTRINLPLGLMPFLGPVDYPTRGLLGDLWNLLGLPGSSSGSGRGQGGSGYRPVVSPYRN